jgi:RES domain-containing protein
MQVYRLAKAKYIRDLTGMGARIAGGRWNEKGAAVLYTSESRALATVEYLVHVPIAIIPKNLRMATLEVPDAASAATISVRDLPPNWDHYPPPPQLAKIGTGWIARNSHLLLYVPSAVVPGEHNVLINPAHRDMKHVKIVHVEAYKFDKRLLQ